MADANNNEYVKRKQVIINKDFQFKLIATFLVSVLAATLICTCVIALWVWANSMLGNNIFEEQILIVNQKTEEVKITGEDGKEEIKKITRSGRPIYTHRWEIIIPPLLLNNLIIMIVIAIIGIQYSHQIAGPAYRISKDIQRALEGEKDIKIRLRKKDKLKELADEVNILLEEYYKKA